MLLRAQGRWLATLAAAAVALILLFLILRGGGGEEGGVVVVGTLRGGVSSLDLITGLGIDNALGFKVKPVYFTKTLDLRNALEKGDIDVAIIPAEFVAKMREAGSDIVILAVDFYQNQAVVVRGNISATSLEDLRGRNLGVFRPTGTYAMFKAYMKALYSIDVENYYNIVDLPPPQLVEAFHRGDVDAVVLWEPLVSKLVSDGGGRILVEYKQLWSKWSDHIGSNGVMIVYAAQRGWAEKRRGLVEKLLKARARAAAIWNNEPETAQRILVEKYQLSREAAKLCRERLRMEEAETVTRELARNIEAVWTLARLGGYISRDPAELARGAFWGGS